MPAAIAGGSTANSRAVIQMMQQDIAELAAALKPFANIRPSTFFPKDGGPMSLEEQPSAPKPRAKKARAPTPLPVVLKDETEAAATLIAHLRAVEGETGDHELIRDMVEGETGLVEAIEAALKTIGEDEAAMDAIKEYRGKLKFREDRIGNRVKAYRAAVTNAMETIFEDSREGDKRSLRTPFATVTLKDGGDEVIIDDITAIPSGLWRQPEPPPLEPDAKAMRDRLEALAASNEDKPEEEREKFDWAHLAPKGSSIAIKRN